MQDQGHFHRTVADTYRSMARVLKSQGNLEDAMESFRMALEIRKKTLGEPHSSIADTYNKHGSCTEIAWKAG
jgi:tetratricopeptide (TPR) repeat protein